MEVADSALVPRLIEMLREGEHSEEERFSLMALTVASVDLGLSDDAGKKMLDKLRPLLLTDATLHTSTIYYWAEPVLDGQDGESWFAVSPFMAGVWREVSGTLFLMTALA